MATPNKGKEKAPQADGQKKAEQKKVILGPPFHCTFKGCTAKYETLKHLQKHKIQTPEHEYCALCDLDFEDDEAFLLHKVKEIEHIVCPICSEDFRSQEGCDRHVRQTHAAEQNIVCVGCGDKFVRAGGLMAHIELNRCPRIPKREFERRRAQKELIRAFLADPEDKKNVFRSEVTESVDGGVPVNLGSLLDIDDTISVHSGIPLEPRRASPAISGIGPPPSVTESWPKLDTTSYRSEQEDEDLLLDIDELSMKRGLTPVPSRSPSLAPKSPNASNKPFNSGWGSVASASTILFPNARPTPVPPTWAAHRSDFENVLHPERLNKIKEEPNPFHPNHKLFDVRNFFNPVTGKYKCPHQSCGRSLPTAKAFEAHLTSPAHTGPSVRCPSCLKIFSSTTALVQHCESASNRCRISESNHFGQAMDTFSGGVIETKGHHADGTVKYGAANNFW